MKELGGMTAGAMAVDEAVAAPVAAGAAASERPGTGRLGWIGSVIAALGAWGAGVAYFGPALGLGGRGWQAWQSTPAHTALNLLPGLATVVAGAAIVRSRRSVDGTLRRAGGALAAASAGWFVLGPTIYPIVYGPGAPAYTSTGRGHLIDLATVASYGRGLGIALGILAGLALVGAGPAVPSAAQAAGSDADETTLDLTSSGRKTGTARDAHDVWPTGADKAARTLGPVVPPAITTIGAAQPDGPGWRPQFRSKISRMVPRPSGQEEPAPSAARVAPLGRGLGVAGSEPGQDMVWRPRFMATSPTDGSAQPAAPAGGEQAAVLPRTVLEPGEWLVAAFRQARLLRTDSGQESSEPGHEGVITQGTAAVTNRRVIFNPHGRREVRGWSLDQLGDQTRETGTPVIDLTDGAALDFADPGAGGDFVAAVHAASSARHSSR